jgi:hypothetical protein
MSDKTIKLSKAAKSMLSALKGTHTLKFLNRSAEYIITNGNNSYEVKKHIAESLVYAKLIVWDGMESKYSITYVLTPLGKQIELN